MIIHSISGYISTLHLVQYPERECCLLLDTGMPSDFYRVRFYVENVVFPGRKMEDVLTLVVSTHCHIDHIGAGYHFGKKVPVVTTKNWERYYAGWKGRMQYEFDRILSLTVAWRLGRRHESVFLPRDAALTPPGQASLPQLDEGHAVPFFEDWVAIKCPGHTGHMIMLYHPVTQILYAADFFILHRKEFRAPIPVDIEYAYNHTIHRLRKLDVRYVLLAHQGVVNVEELAGGWNFVLDEVVRHLRKEKSLRITEQLIKLAIGWTQEPRVFTRAELPHNPLPSSPHDPPEIWRLR
jgi:glyoxylase-like metal-dependent hydrolase (beta-lactamase superfamily II)